MRPPGLFRLTAENPLLNDQIEFERKITPNSRCAKTALFVINLVALPIGLWLAYLFWIWFYRQSFLREPCPVAFGKECGGNGVCSIFGKCECDPLYSGTDCSESGCPAYIQEKGVYCNNRPSTDCQSPMASLLPECADPLTANLGRARCFLPSGVRPHACRWEAPAPSNGFAPDNVGWFGKECVDFLTAARTALLATTAVGDTTSFNAIPNLEYVPECFCPGIFDGFGCESSACPTDVDGNICSGNGNTSVSTFTDVTDGSGNGCQCTNVWSPLDPAFLRHLNDRQAAYLISQPGFATQLFCGRYYVTSTGFVVLIKTPIAGTAYSTPNLKCHCKLGIMGEGCQDGKCPMDSTGAICSSHGAPAYGEGLQVAVKANRFSPTAPATVRCAPDTQKCPKTNQCTTTLYPTLFAPTTLCTVKEVAPPTTPWRCPDGTLASLGNLGLDSCSLGYTVGTLDPSAYDLVRATAVCDLTTLVGLAACFPSFTPTNLSAPILDNATSSGASWISTQGLAVSSIDRTFARPLAWFLLDVTNPSTTQNATVQVSYASLAWSFVVLPSQRTSLYASPRLDASLLALLAFADTTYTTTLGYVYGTYQIQPVPLLDTVPTMWRQIRLRNVVDNTYVVAQASTLTTVLLDPSVLPTEGGWVAAILPNGAGMFTTDGGAESSASCLVTPSGCAWTFLSGAMTTATNTTFACLSGTTWYLSSVWCPANLTYVRVLETALSIQQFGQITSTTPFLVRGWRIQLPVPDASKNWTVHITSFPVVVATAAEFVTHAALQASCACAPPVVVNARNRTELNQIWCTDTSRSRATFVVGDTVALFFSVYGLPQYQRGTVQSSSLNVTAVSTRDFGVVGVPTTNVRALTTSEFVRGYDDASLDVYTARCPTGYLTTTVAETLDLPESCGCTLKGDGATCECTGAVVCSCSGLSALNTTCSCGAADDGIFEATVSTYVNSSLVGCSCFATTDVLGAVQSPQATTLLQIDLNRTVLAITSATCFQVESVFGIYPEFGGIPVPLAFSSSCGPSGLELLPTLGAEKFPILNVTATHPTAVVFPLVVQYTPGGVPVSDVVSVSYAASSNLPLAHLVGSFATSSYTWWYSSQQFVERPVWVAALFGNASVVSRVFLNVRTAGLTVLSYAAPLAVRLQIQALTQDGEWVEFGEVVSTASNTTEVWVVASTTSAASTTLFWGVRVLSEYPLAVNQLLPLVDQQCECLGGEIAGANLVAPIPPLDPSVLLEAATTHYSKMNASAGECIYTDACFVVIQGLGVRDVSNNGFCNDLLFPIITDHVAVSTLTTTQVSSNTSFSYFLDNAYEWNATDGSGKRFYTTGLGTPTAAFVWILWSPSMSAAGTPNQLYVLNNEVRMFAQVNSTGIGNDTSAGYLWFFADAADAVFDLPNSYFDSRGFYQLLEVETTVYTPSITPLNGYCPPGYDGTDCGNNLRYAARSPLLGCSISSIQQYVWDSAVNKTIPDPYHVVSELLANGATVFVSLAPFDRTRAVLGGGCTTQVCPLGTQRCADGRCATASECAQTTLYDVAGNGCTQNEISGAHHACACDRGRSGLACQFGVAKPADPKYGKIPAAQQITSGGPPSLTLRPPISNGLAELNFVDPLRYVQLTRQSKPRLPPNVELRNDPATGQIVKYLWTNDIQEVDFKSFAPGYGSKMLVKRVAGDNTVVFSNCPFMAEGSFGQYILLTDAVQTRDPTTGVVTKWKPFYDGAGNQIFYFFNKTQGGLIYEASFDVFPWRCPNGGCYKDGSYCTQAMRDRPPCNDRSSVGGVQQGQPMADATCVCLPGWMSWFLNSQQTVIASSPYLIDSRTGAAATAVWNQPTNDNWRTFGPQWCNAVDCSVADCSTPMACFPGTPDRGFKDRLIPCPSTVTNALDLQTYGVARTGMCGVSVQQCTAGVGLVPKQVCGGKGIVYQEAYRYPPVMSCYCGDPISLTQTIADITSISELKRNGYGGRDCTERSCTSSTDTVVYFAQRDLSQNAPYTDLGVPIAGRYGGFCGSPIGADPDELPLWNKCCSEYRLDRCTSVPCRVGGDVVCMAPPTCSALGYQPLVYPCNNHGTPTKGGVCFCDNANTKGVGYIADYTRFEHDNCFQKVSCPISPTNGAVCGQCQPYDVECWIRFNTYKYVENQTEAIMGGAGLPFNNRTVVPYFSDPYSAQVTLTQGVIQVAYAWNDSVNAQQACVCLCEGDTDPTNPSCMLPYDPALVGTFLQGYTSPYLLTDGNWSRMGGYNGTALQKLMTDGHFTAFPAPPDYVNFTGTLSVDFAISHTVTNVRMFARAGYSSVVRFLDGAGNSVCPPQQLPVPSGFDTTWDWVTVYCTAVYAPYDFVQNQYTLNLQYCGPVAGGSLAATPTCINWKKEICRVVGGIYQDTGALVRLRGCSVSQCCVVVNAVATVPTTHLRIVFSAPVPLQQLEIYGYSDKALTPAAPISEYCVGQLGGGDNAACAHSPDYPYMNQCFNNRASGSYYVPNETHIVGNQSQQYTYDEALGLCPGTGGWLASTNDVMFQGISRADAISQVFPQPYTITKPASAWVALHNQNRYGLNTTTDAFVDAQVPLTGCRTILADAGYGSYPWGIYSARNRNQYKVGANQWIPTSGTLLSWSTYFRTINLAPFPNDPRFYGFAAFNGPYIISVFNGRAGTPPTPAPPGYPDLQVGSAFNPSPIDPFSPYDQTTIVAYTSPEGTFAVTGGYDFYFTKKVTRKNTPEPNPFSATTWTSPDMVVCSFTVYRNADCTGANVQYSYAWTPDKDAGLFIVNSGLLVINSALPSGYKVGDAVPPYLRSTPGINQLGHMLGTKDQLLTDGSKFNSGLMLSATVGGDSWNCVIDFCSGFAANTAECRGLYASSSGLSVRIGREGGGKFTSTGYGGRTGPSGNEGTCIQYQPAWPSMTIFPYIRPAYPIYHAEVRLETLPFTTFVAGNVPRLVDGYVPSVMGWGDGAGEFPYMCQSMQVHINVACDSSTGFRCVQYIFPSAPNYSPTPHPLQQTDNEPRIPWTSPTGAVTLRKCADLGHAVGDCRYGEIPRESLWAWHLSMNPPTGDTWPSYQVVDYFARLAYTDGQSDTTAITQDPIVLKFAPNQVMPNVGPIHSTLATDDGYRNLASFFFDTTIDSWIVFTDMTSRIDVSERFVVWTNFDCGAVLSDGRLTAYACEAKLSWVCQFDWWKFTVRTGNACGPKKCGSSARQGGYPQPNQTCLTLFDEAVNNPVGREAYQRYLDGTLQSWIGIDDAHFDAARAYTITAPGYDYGPNLPGARRRLNEGISTLKGHLSQGEVADTVYGTNLDVEGTWSVLCNGGEYVYSRNTGKASIRIAVSTDFCNPDAHQLEPAPLPLDELPTVLFNVDRTVNPIFEPTCGNVLMLGSFVVVDRWGIATPFTDYINEADTFYDVVDDQNLHSLKLQAVVTRFSLFNTGKNPGFYVFASNVTTTIAGTIEIDCVGCNAGFTATVTVWVAPLDPLFAYPTSGRKLVAGSFSVTEGTGPTEYAVSVTPTNVSFVYQVVGYDLTGLEVGAVVTFSNPVLTTPATRFECTNSTGLRGITPKFSARSSIDVGIPNNVCALDEMTILYWGGTQLGGCICDVSAGTACECPAFATPYGMLCGGGGGDIGSVVSPVGTVVKTSTAPGVQGLYFYQMEDGTIETGVKTIDVGRNILSRLWRLTLAPLVIYQLETTYGEDPYVLLTALEGLAAFNTYSQIESVAYAASAVVPEITTPQQFAWFVLVAAGLFPTNVFANLVQNVQSVQGDSSWVWGVSGIEFLHCLDPKYCGVVMDWPIVCGAGTWSDPLLCSTVNAGNVAYQLTSSPIFDGSWQFSMTTGTWNTRNNTSPTWVYVFSKTGVGQCTGATICSSSTPYSTSLVEGGATTLKVYSCSANVQTIALNACNVAEIFQFDQRDGSRSPVYPWYDGLVP